MLRNKSGRLLGARLLFRWFRAYRAFFELLFLAGVLFLLEVVFFDEPARLFAVALAIVWCLEAR